MEYDYSSPEVKNLLTPPEKASASDYQAWVKSLPFGLLHPTDTTHWPVVQPPDGLSVAQYRIWLESLPHGILVDNSEPHFEYIKESVARDKEKFRQYRFYVRGMIFGALLGVLAGYLLWKA